MTRPSASLRIFQIGFNRCGTKSLAEYFLANGLRAAHWRKGKLAYGIELARREGRPLLDYVDGYQVYTDMERVDLGAQLARRFRPRLLRRLEPHLRGEERERPIYAFEYFRELDRQYPGARFILNLRDPDAWLESRWRFRDGGYRDCKCGARRHDSKVELFACWRAHWEAHVAAVKAHFADRPSDLLVFDIDRDSIAVLNRFFANLALDPTRWLWINRTRAVESME